MDSMFHPAAKKRHKGLMLSENEVIDWTAFCPICLSAAPRKPIYQIQRAPPIHFLKCTKCHGASASHMPSPETVKSIYDDFYLESDTEKFTFHGVQRLVDHIFRRIHLSHMSHSQKIYRILEIGGGDGTLSKEIGNRILHQNSQLEIEISEVELYKGEDTVDETVKLRFFESLTQVEGRFDLVIASAVLHQIPENNEILGGLFARVRNGGVFFARTAFILPIARLLGPFIDTLYPFHVHDLGCHFWNSVPDKFSLNAEILSSRPSLVESQISRAPINALAGHLLKFPARLELLVAGRNNRCPSWTFVGGWEVFLKFH